MNEKGCRFLLCDNYVIKLCVIFYCFNPTESQTLCKFIYKLIFQNGAVFLSDINYNMFLIL